MPPGGGFQRVRRCRPDAIYALFGEAAAAVRAPTLRPCAVAPGEQEHRPVVLVAIEGIAVDFAQNAVQRAGLRPLPEHPAPVAIALRRLGGGRAQPEGIVEMLMGGCRCGR